jgi:hypothetical protein
MRTTSVDLYRMGNATSPRMDKVRDQDVESYEKNGEIWVVEGSGGISTFAAQGLGKNWWKLDRGCTIDIFKNSNEPIKKVFRGFNEIDTSNIFLRKIKHFTDF